MISYPPPKQFVSINNMFIGVHAITRVKKHENGDVEVFLIAESKPMVFSGDNAKNLIDFLDSTSESIPS